MDDSAPGQAAATGVVPAAPALAAPGADGTRAGWVVLASPAQARQALDPLVRHWLGGGEMVRVKVWTSRGTVLYSDEPRLVGQTLPLDDGFRAALLRPRTEADITDLSLPENRYERGEGKLLEVYRPVWTPDGTSLLFETYFRHDTVSQRSQQLWRGFDGVTLSSLLALLLLLGAVTRPSGLSLETPH